MKVFSRRPRRRARRGAACGAQAHGAAGVMRTQGDAGFGLQCSPTCRRHAGIAASFMAGSDQFAIIVRVADARSTPGGIDPIVVGSQIVMGGQTSVSAGDSPRFPLSSPWSSSRPVCEQSSPKARARRHHGIDDGCRRTSSR